MNFTPMQPKINDEVFRELLNCERSAFLAIKNYPEVNRDYLDNNNLLKSEMAKIIAKSHIAEVGKCALEETISTKDNRLETKLQFQFTTHNESRLYCCFPVHHKLSKYEYLQAAYSYFIANSIGKKITKLIVVRFKNSKDKPDMVNEDNFIYTDITNHGSFKLWGKIVSNAIDKLNSYLKNNSTPRTQFGGCCIKPYTCPLKKLCFEKELGKEENIFDLKDTKFNSLLRLYWKGVVKIDDINSTEILPKRTDRHIEAYKRKKEFIHLNELSNSYKLLYGSKELLFLDIEFLTFICSSSNYSESTITLPYSYSLIHYDETNGAQIYNEIHDLYINAGSYIKLISNLIRLINHFDNLFVVVFNKKRIVNALIKLIPKNSQEYYELKKIFNKMWDLREVIVNREYYHPKFKGSNYLKDISLVTSPDTYLDSDKIKTGKQAENYYKTCVLNGNGLTETNKKELLNYVDKDALAIMQTFYFLKGKLFNLNNRSNFA